jgi:uncharacterized membrane protein YeaQ/YmgE (transglycosylase-associated protein family)
MSISYGDRGKNPLMEFMYWIVMGLFAGFLAKAQFPAKRDENIFVLLVIGSIGALLGGWIMHGVGGTGVMSWAFWTYAVAFLGAALLLVAERTLTVQRAA